ncbi:alpha-L-fucosidase [Sphingomonas sp. SM33]|uniref:alpha-L-fucosidase n=1 Tax=Sphingomonas telluris TaxID=2907998 RepID=A0ABS9VQN6_9SPHN|nr:alpha-L-fucosidase [Sphingomonas telluris]MCH8617293.1 alpha-L-fucosidase [Sphingomonas telluris]
MFSRRDSIAAGAAALLASSATGLRAETLQPTEVPDWFRDAKFGIWAHWGPQCVPEMGDWYGRLMYVQGHAAYEHHVRTYGHPSKTGFLDIIGRWKAEEWQPEYLLRRYKQAGARYFMAMANHHDNFDMFDSTHQGWNSVRAGPRRDIVGTWEKLARQAGLKFGVSNHSGHAWHWWQTAYGYDADGPLKGRRYDAFWLRKKHGAGTWWDGLDPQDLYTGPSFVPPDGIDTIKAMDDWHGARDGQWLEDAPQNPAFVSNWLLRQKDLVAKYRPDLVYFDDYGIPFGPMGLDAMRDFYAHAPEGVLTAKRLTDEQRRIIVEDVERGFVADIQPRPWQTDTCIGNWHYDRPLYERGGYKSAKQVVQRLADVVSKNGCLLLSIPVRGNGAIDDKEERILDDLAAWFRVNGEAIYGSRPWRRFGEGPTKPPLGVMAEGEAKPFVADDIRFTAKCGTLYAALLDWPSSEVAIASLGSASGRVERVTLLGGPPLAFQQTRDALRLTLPPAGDKFVPVLRIDGAGLAA